jgi:NTE family protein
MTSPNFDVVVERVRQMVDSTVDAGAIIGGILLPGSISERIAKAYDKKGSLLDSPQEKLKITPL